MVDRIQRRGFLAASAAALLCRTSRRVQAFQDQLPVMRGETTEAVGRAMAFLASRQKGDGRFGASPYAENAAVVALAGLAFMSAGSTPGRGPHGREVNRCIRFLLNRAEESGFIDSPGHGPMYGHGFATLFLAEA